MDARTTWVQLPEARVYDGLPFPGCVVPAAENGAELSGDVFAAWARENATKIHAELRAHGALLFRGFGGADGAALNPKLFGRFVDALGLPNFPYVGGNAVRTLIPDTDGRVFTANESPPEKPIPFHHELAQTPVFPARLLFFCERPAETDGETPILHSTRLLDDLVDRFPDFVRDLETHGVRYSRVMTRNDRPSSAIGRGWAATFRAQSRSEAEAALSSRGYSWEWLDPRDPSKPASDDDENALLREVSPRLSAVCSVAWLEGQAKKAASGDSDGTKEASIEGPGAHAKEAIGVSGDEATNSTVSGADSKRAPPRASRAFFNQLLAVWGGWRDEYNEPAKCVRLGNGDPLNADAMNDAIRLAADQKVAIPWQRGDIMFIDNFQVQHARNTFTGPRRVLASLTK